MGFSLINVDMGDGTIPKSIEAVHSFWSDIDTRQPILGAIMILMLPVIVIYFIYTWGSIRKRESEIDAQVKAAHTEHKRRKGDKS
ncbi:hypothetical protein [Kluyvera intermedia]|uniref:hypothetical protein n=1 Tax=Kluyvera intermedia TaxID=61648 RepID=UPI00352456ED